MFTASRLSAAYTHACLLLVHVSVPTRNETTDDILADKN